MKLLKRQWRATLNSDAYAGITCHSLLSFRFFLVPTAKQLTSCRQWLPLNLFHRVYDDLLGLRKGPGGHANVSDLSWHMKTGLVYHWRLVFRYGHSEHSRLWRSGAFKRYHKSCSGDLNANDFTLSLWLLQVLFIVFGMAFSVFTLSLLTEIMLRSNVIHRRTFTNTCRVSDMEEYTTRSRIHEYTPLDAKVLGMTVLLVFMIAFGVVYGVVIEQWCP